MNFNKLFSLNKTNTLLTLSSVTLITGVWYYRNSIKQQFIKTKPTPHHKGTMTNTEDENTEEKNTEEKNTEEKNDDEEEVVITKDSTFRLFR